MIESIIKGIGLGLFLALSVGPVIMTVVIRIYHKAKILKKKTFNELYGAINEGLTLSGFAGKYWYILVLVRWTVVSVILIALRDFSTF